MSSARERVGTARERVIAAPARLRGVVRRREPRVDDPLPPAFEQSEALLQDPLLMLRRTETALVRADLGEPNVLAPAELDRLRFVLSLARLTAFEAGGRTVDLTDLGTEYRARVLAQLCEPLQIVRDPHGRLTLARKMLDSLADATVAHRQALLDSGRCSPAELDAEVTNRSLVLVLGGGAGAGHVYLGALETLAAADLLPSYVMGTSIGSLYGSMLTRSATPDFAELRAFAHGLSLGAILGPPRRTRRHGMPGMFTLTIEDVLGPMLQRAGRPLRLRDTPTPFEAVVAGVRQSAFDSLPSRFRHAEISRLSALSRGGIAKGAAFASRMWQVGAFFDSRVAKPIVFGADELTRDMRVLDAVGFSCAVPGVLHYETAAADERPALDRLLREKDVRALIDGGVSSNVAIELAWRRVQDGRIGTRNAVLLAFDCFHPQWDSRHLWLTPITQSLQVQMVRNAPFADWIRRFSPTLSVLDLVPPPDRLRQAELWGRESVEPDLPLITKLVSPAPWVAQPT